jgi:hypothetical protein
MIVRAEVASFFFFRAGDAAKKMRLLNAGQACAVYSILLRDLCFRLYQFLLCPPFSIVSTSFSPCPPLIKL